MTPAELLAHDRLARVPFFRKDGSTLGYRTLPEGLPESICVVNMTPMGAGAATYEFHLCRLVNDEFGRRYVERP